MPRDCAFENTVLAYQLSLSNQKLTALDNERSLLYLNLGNLIQSGLEWHKTLIPLIKLIKENLSFQHVACLKFDPEMQKLGQPIIVEGDEGFKSRVLVLEHLDLRETQLVEMLDDGKSVLLKERTHSEIRGEKSLLNHLQFSAVVLIPLRENGKTAFVLLAGHGNETARSVRRAVYFSNQPVPADLRCFREGQGI